MDHSDAVALVADGVVLMDRLARPDWRERIVVDALDMADASACVAGQAWGSWLGVPDAVRYHPAFAGDLDREDNADDIEALRVAWVEYLTTYAIDSTP